jgi:hypothetical protein
MALTNDSMTNYLPLAFLYRRDILTRLLWRIRHSRFSEIEELGHIRARSSSHGAGYLELICHPETMAEVEVNQMLTNTPSALN